jgi:gluconolactonase
MLLDLEMVTEGLGFPEGPVAMTDGSVLLVEMAKQTLSRVTADGRIEVVVNLGGGPNGAAVGPDGAIYICNNGGSYTFVQQDGLTIPGDRPEGHRGGSIQRVDLASGKVTTLYDRCNGVPLLAPNDLVFDKAGGFWFTDSGTQDSEGTRHGALLYATIDGGSIVRAARLPTPNGVGLSPDGCAAYVADTLTGRLWVLDVFGPGKVGPGPLPIMPGRVVQTLPGFQLLDSLAVEASGRVCVATIINGGITVFTTDGETEHLAVPDLIVTNICFGGEDLQDAWITASGTGKLYKTRWPRPGLKLAFNL